MISDIAKKADSYLEGAQELLKKLISFKSVMDAPEENAPYGRECARVMEFIEETLRTEGFAVKNFDNHAVTAAFDEREPALGVLAHLDVVPAEGQNWQTDPFTAEIKNGRIYGRGAIDDKGPAAAVITAMKIIRDSAEAGEITLTRNMRLILGSNEENGSSDMEYYTKREAFPEMLFTPDGCFPVITMEKGMVRYDMTCTVRVPEDSRAITKIDCTGPYNAVPEKAYAEVRGVSPEDIRQAAAQPCLDGITVNTKPLTENVVQICVCGKAAHASTPEKGCNALTALCALLSGLDVAGNEPVRRLSERFPFGDNDGTHAGMRHTDERMGSTTVVMTRMQLYGRAFCAGFDCRFPSSATCADIVNSFDREAAACGLSGKAVISSESHDADANSELVRTLLSVYEDFTGKEGRCISIGGGTYVHDTKNGVAFGAEWSDENNMHGADEFIGIEEFRDDIIIYTEALLRLLTVKN